ncbi:MAG: PEP/pyruvate-binding domain-containing protein [Flavobacteriaceae bacterium]
MARRMVQFIILLSFLTTLCAQHGNRDADPDNSLKELIERYKKDIRGPYKILNWYCNDGRINPANEPCGDEIGGVQRATYKDEVVRLGQNHHIFLGQILATTDYDAFWDAANNSSRLKQYQLEKYLKSVDNGWINRRAQFYRGAMQAEDEEDWGKKFFEMVLMDDQILEKHFFLLREAAKDIPHSGDDNTAQRMRSESKTIADQYKAFMNLRIKIHGQPEASDIEDVIEFKNTHSDRLSNNLNKKFDQLIATMKEYFKPIDISEYRKYVIEVKQDEIRDKLESFLNNYASTNAQVQIQGAVELMWFIREQIGKEMAAKGRLALLDLSLELEELVKTRIGDYPDQDLEGTLDKICLLSTASAASGFTEIWEWETLMSRISATPVESLALGELNQVFEAARRQLEWGTGKNRAVYEDVVSRYEVFEPLVHGFLDDRIRGSVMLSLGNSIGRLGNFVAEQSSLQNKLLDISNQGHVHGLNPGYASGVLVVVDGSAEGMEVNPDRIYVFESAPSDLKPVSGILTISEGNLVSHVQLLARNLGIPNAAISQSNLDDLKKYHGQEVFYAVSNQGTVLMKPFADATPEEAKLVRKIVKDEDMITIPVDQIKLENNSVLDMRNLNAKSSGIYCGPKAANLGELKELFPELVVEGIVIPFGVFLDHMEQNMPNKDQTYWEYLNKIFENARNMKSYGASSTRIETYILTELNVLRQSILSMTLKSDFIDQLENSFRTVLGSSLGQTPVFLRSDTNMEDLKNFTGAGLNLTLFNVLEKEKILNGIKAVWASPYTERSFKWRQKYLTNPENVYPSILIIPGVDNDCSGVMITKGVSSGNEDEITVAMSRGVGGAVDGQSAETWTIRQNRDDELISPARELKYLSLPTSGSTKSNWCSLEKPLLSSSKRDKLYTLSQGLIQKMKSKNIEGPYDVELGFKDEKIWLFQVRPFVENKNAVSSEYLESISPPINKAKIISTKTQLQE